MLNIKYIYQIVIFKNSFNNFHKHTPVLSLHSMQVEPLSFLKLNKIINIRVDINVKNSYIRQFYFTITQINSNVSGLLCNKALLNSREIITKTRHIYLVSIEVN